MGAVPGVSFASRTTAIRSLCIALFLIALAVLALQPNIDDQVRQIQSHLPEPKLPSFAAQHHRPRNCSINATHAQYLQETYGLQDEIEYGKRYIHFVQRDISRRSITTLDAKLFGDPFAVIDIHEPPSDQECAPPLEVTIPKSLYPSNVDAAELLFGISTTFQRLNDSKINPIQDWAHWLTDGKGKSNGAGLVLLLLDASTEELNEAEKMMERLGIDAKVQHSDSSVIMAVRYLNILPTLYNHPSRTARKWMIVCDDDTFFPRMNALVDKLHGLDHNQDYYIGTLSEDVNNIERHGSQAFGGAGVIFSVPMAAKVSALFSQCNTDEKIEEADSGWGPQGDILLRKCIYEHTEVRLTLMNDLNQLDIMGDVSGFYESGQAPLSLHHFKGGIWHTAYPHEMVKISHACGEDCVLQRFRTTDDFIISNGYSIAFYPRGIDFDVDQMERTFEPHPADMGWNLDYAFGPQRTSLLQTGRKISWEMREAVVNDDGSVRQTYVRLKDDPRWTVKGQPLAEYDGVFELVWFP